MKPLLPALTAALALLAPAADAARAPDVIRTSIRFTGPPARALAQALHLPLEAPARVVFTVGRLPEQPPVETTAVWDPRRGDLRITGYLRDLTTASPVRSGPVCELASPMFGAPEIDGLPGWKPVFLALQQIAPVPGQGPILDTRTLELPLSADQRAVLTQRRVDVNGTERLALSIVFGPPVESGTSCRKLGRPLR